MRMMRSKFRCWTWVCLLIATAVHPTFADEIETLFVRANEHYQNSDYVAAISEYNKIRDLGYESWEVYYNLGNAYYKNGEIARAILNYERAKRLNSENEDINFNLELANLSVVDRIPQLPKFLLFVWISELASLVSFQWLGMVTISLYLLFMALMMLRILLRTSSLTRLLHRSMITAGVVLVVVSGLFLVRIYENESITEAIVMTNKVDVMSAPGEAGTELFTLHEGVKVQIQEHSGNWLKIRLADGKVGWLREDHVEQI